MRKYKVIVGAVLLIAALSVGWAGLANAYNFKTGMNVSLGQSQKIDNTVFAAGNTVDIASEVFGDVFCAGQTVTVSGTVHGDVICAGQTVVITGHVTGDVRAAGQAVSVGANVDGNVSVGGQSFNLTSDSKIAGDLSVGAATATLNGRVGRDLAAAGETVIIASQVGRNVHGIVNHLQLTSGARVNGNIDFSSDLEADKASGAVVSGKITRSDLPRESRPDLRSGLAWRVYWFAAMLFMALVFTLLFPSVLHQVSEQAVRRPWRVLMIGFLANIAAPVVMLLLAVTVIGLPLALVLGLLWIVAILLSWLFFGYYLGRLILNDSRRPLLIILTGASLLIIVCQLPVIGLIAFLLALWFGTGMVLLEAMRRLPRPVYKLPVDKVGSKTTK